MGNGIGRVWAITTGVSMALLSAEGSACQWAELQMGGTCVTFGPTNKRGCRFLTCAHECGRGFLPDSFLCRFPLGSSAEH